MMNNNGFLKVVVELPKIEELSMPLAYLSTTVCPKWILGTLLDTFIEESVMSRHYAEAIVENVNSMYDELGHDKLEFEPGYGYSNLINGLIDNYSDFCTRIEMKNPGFEQYLRGCIRLPDIKNYGMNGGYMAHIMVETNRVA